MGAHRPSLDQVFILRFWREETGTSDQGSWRVMVRNINTRHRDVVDDVQRAFAIVAGSLSQGAGEDKEPSATDTPSNTERKWQQ